MKQKSLNSLIIRLRICIVAFILAGFSLFLFSFTPNENLFVPKRLVQFPEETKDIEYIAALTQKNGKKVFVNGLYEHNGNYWKMDFRAVKNVVEPSGEFVQQWLNEIK